MRFEAFCFLSAVIAIEPIERWPWPDAQGVCRRVEGVPILGGPDAPDQPAVAIECRQLQAGLGVPYLESLIAARNHPFAIGQKVDGGDITQVPPQDVAQLEAAA